MPERDKITFPEVLIAIIVTVFTLFMVYCAFKSPPPTPIPKTSEEACRALGGIPDTSLLGFCRPNDSLGDSP